MAASSRTNLVRLAARPDDIEFDLSAAAIVVVDMQNAYLSKGGYLDLAGFDVGGTEKVIASTSHLLEAARNAGVRVVYLQNGWDPDYVEAGGERSPNQAKSNALRLMRERTDLKGSLLSKGGWDYRLREEVAPQEGDIVVPKSRYSGFVNSLLDSVLRSRGITHLLVLGVATNVCVETTIRDAFGLEYFPILVSDCCHQAGPSYVQEATIYNVETFFGWTATSHDVVALFAAG